jgi:helix-turn-helix protein
VVAALGAERSIVEKFIPAVFKTILNDTLVKIKHPARRGGRVTDADFESALLSVARSAVTFDTDGRQVTIPNEAVIGFSRTQQDFDGVERRTLVVRHIEDGTATTTLVLTESPRTLSLLGRYPRR